MVPAPDHGFHHPRRWFCLGIVVAACVGQAGCARLSPFRKPASPAFGTESAARDATGSGSSTAGGDLYAEMVGRPTSGADPAAKRRTELAKAGQEHETEDEAVAASTPAAHAKDSGPSIVLQPPITLPAFSSSHDDLTAVASRSAAAFGWKAETKLRPDTVAAASESAPASAAPTLDALLSQCRQKLDAMTTYQVKMNHQERVGILLNPAEDVLLSIRRSPKAVRIEWRDGPHKGREVLYAADARSGQMHVRMGEALLAMPRLSMAPDSPIALKNGRHPIDEAGFDTVVSRIEDGLKKQKAGDPSGGKLAYAGLEKPDGVDKPCHKITRVMPTGETWVVYLDPDSSIPAYIQETAANGDLLERYVFHDLAANVAELTKAEAFDPDARWGPATGILQRLARAANNAGEAPKTR
jgi:Protein of unknown function (DUF1571)